MINARMIYKVLGSLLFIEALMLLLCFGLTIYFQEDDLFAFSVAAIITAVAGYTLRYFGRETSGSLSRREAFMVVTLSWTLFSLFGTLPFLLGGYITNFTDAFFESMSGFSTTGATVLLVDSLPHGILFWRSLSQWIGGLGIVFFTIAILPSITGGSVRVFAAEATGPIKSKLHPKISTSAKWIWSIYTLLTLLCIGSLWLLGVGWFDAVNYGMTTTATGGFATHDSADAFYTSPAIDYTIALFAFLSGINFVLLYTAFIKLRIKRLFDNVELRTYCWIIVLCTVFAFVEMFFMHDYDVEHALRTALFSVVSFITTTGIFNQDVVACSPALWTVLALCMILGGMSGSTTGGLKCIRGIIFWKMIKNEFRQMLHPTAVLPLNIDGANINTQRRASLMSLIAVYIMLVFIGVIIISVTGMTTTHALSITLSCLTNSGYSLAEGFGAAADWQGLSVIAKWVCSALMLMGRLEIFTVLVIFTPNYWNEN